MGFCVVIRYSKIIIIVHMLLAAQPCQGALACEYNNITVHVGGASFKNLVSLLYTLPKAMTAMICEIFFVGREGYMESKMVIKFGAMFLALSGL